ncbi:MAG: hypothetical protein U0232_04800 [Thermomicrobiales bacterium]
MTAEDVAAGGTWALHLVNYEAGAANGTFELTFTPLGQPLPTPSPTRTPTPTPTRHHRRRPRTDSRAHPPAEHPRHAAHATDRKTRCLAHIPTSR